MKTKTNKLDLGKKQLCPKANLSCYYSERERNTNNLARQNMAQHIYRK